ncbi:MAG TPA: type II secretion system protein GspM [Spirochaetota bacterium]|nr:type II secretion system protein GspM [Spirochaetota bacterium]
MINLNDREKKLLFILAGILITGFVYYFILSPIIEFKKNSDDIYNKNRLKINKLDDIYSEYRDIITEKSKLSAVASGNSGIGSMVDEIASSLKIASNKVYLKENPGIVQNSIQKMTTEIKFEGVPVKELLEFLNRIENSNTPLKIQSLVIYSGIKERSRYDAVITIVSLSKR